jgi:hypothetical protein
MIIFFLGDYNIQIVAITEIEPSLWYLHHEECRNQDQD